MKKILVLMALFLVGCNVQSSISSQLAEDIGIAVGLLGNVKTFDTSLEFKQGFLYLESESIYDDEGDYLGNKQYFVILDPGTKEKRVSDNLEGQNKDPKLATINGEDRIFVRHSEAAQLAEDLGYYSLPSMTYTPLNIPNPGTTWQYGVTDYFLVNDMIYYLQGCRGIFCNIHQFDLSSGKNKILTDIDVEGMDRYAINLGEKLSENGDLYLLDGFGIDGSGYISVDTFSLKNASIEPLEYESKLFSCEDGSDWMYEEYSFSGEECTKYQLEQNHRYDVIMENYFKKIPQGCDDYQIEYSNEREKHLLILESEMIELGDWVELIACN